MREILVDLDEPKVRAVLHLLMLAFPGKTAQHLRSEHGIEPLRFAKGNARLHAAAHHVDDESLWTRQMRALVPCEQRERTQR